MTIKIERAGVIKPRTWKGTCRGCGAVVSWHDQDCVTIHAGDQRDGPYSILLCPTIECNASINGYPVKL